MVLASALTAVAVTLGIVAVYCPAGPVLALVMPDVVTAAVAMELAAVSVVSAVQSPLCTAAAELQVSAAARQTEFASVFV